MKELTQTIRSTLTQEKMVCEKCGKIIGKRRKVLILTNAENDPEIPAAPFIFCSQECFDTWQYEFKYGQLPNPEHEKIDEVILKDHHRMNPA